MHALHFQHALHAVRVPTILRVHVLFPLLLVLHVNISIRNRLALALCALACFVLQVSHCRVGVAAAPGPQIHASGDLFPVQMEYDAPRLRVTTFKSRRAVERERVGVAIA